MHVQFGKKQLQLECTNKNKKSQLKSPVAQIWKLWITRVETELHSLDKRGMKDWSQRLTSGKMFPLSVR